MYCYSIFIDYLKHILKFFVYCIDLLKIFKKRSILLLLTEVLSISSQGTIEYNVEIIENICKTCKH